MIGRGVLSWPPGITRLRAAASASAAPSRVPAAGSSFAPEMRLSVVLALQPTQPRPHVLFQVLVVAVSVALKTTKNRVSNVCLSMFSVLLLIINKDPVAKPTISCYKLTLLDGKVEKLDQELISQLFHPGILSWNRF